MKCENCTQELKEDSVHVKHTEGICFLFKSPERALEAFAHKVVMGNLVAPGRERDLHNLIAHTFTDLKETIVTSIKADTHTSQFINELRKAKETERKEAYLMPDILIQMIANKRSDSARMLELIEANKVPLDVVTSDFALYEALECVTKKELDYGKLKSLVKNVMIIPGIKVEISPERLMHLRRVAKMDLEK